MTGRSRDRRVYLAGHPILFALLAATRRWPVRRLGGTVLVHGRDAYVAALTRIPLDRTAHGTTGGAADRLAGADAYFDQHGEAHRQARRSTAEALGAAGVARLRPVWTEILQRRLAPLAAGEELDLVPLAAELSGSTAAALLDLPVDGRELAEAARGAGATAVRDHLPSPFRALHRALSRALLQGPSRALPQGPSRALPRALSHALPRALSHALPRALSHALPRSLPRTLVRGRAGDRSGRAAKAAADRLTALVAPAGGPHAGQTAMLAVAAINTSIAALPRAVAWCADDNLWPYAHSHPRSLADELLRVTAPTPLLPRVAAAEGTLPTSCPAHADAGVDVRAGDRLLLVARHAVAAHRDDPDPARPAPAQVAQLVFGVGPHACPGARLARAQLVDLLVALAPYRPVVVRAKVDRRAALPGWSSLVVRASTPQPTNSDAHGRHARTTDSLDPAARTTDTPDPAARTTDTPDPAATIAEAGP